MTYTKKVLASLTTIAIMASTAVSGVMAADVEVVGNGAGSRNTVRVSDSCTTVVGQSNKTQVTNVISSTADSGHNQTNYNTGGSATTNTGDATSVVEVTVTGGDNNALPDGCCGCDSVGSVEVSNNGFWSSNKVVEKQSTLSVTGQKSKTQVTNLVGSAAKTGKNSVKGNTGGAAGTTTGNSLSVVKVVVNGGSNSVVNP